MTAKEKAQELYDKLYDKIEDFDLQHETASLFKERKECTKYCAIIAVDELIKEQTMWQNGQTDPVLFWQQVKQEINSL